MPRNRRVPTCLNGLVDSTRSLTGLVEPTTTTVGYENWECRRYVGAMDTQTWLTGGGGWLTLAAINAGLAEQKERSRGRWFVISLLIGPLATALIVVWEAPQKR